VRVVDEGRLGGLDLAVPFDVDAVVVVDHDLGHGVVAQERLQRSVAEDVVGDLACDLPPLLAREWRAVERELLGDDAEHLLGEVLGRTLIGLSGRIELRAELRDAGVVDAALQLGIRVLWPALGGVGLPADEHVELGPVAVGGAALAVESVVEAHGVTPLPGSP
jgi:hypothetical protein